MTDRVRSRHGNVIAADFTPRGAAEVAIEAEILYCDPLVCLTRFRLRLGGRVVATKHHTTFTTTD